MSKNGLDVDEDMLPVNLRNDLDDVNNQSEILQAEIEFNDSEIERTREKLNATYVDSNLDVVADRAVETVGTMTSDQSKHLLQQCFKDVSTYEAAFWYCLTNLLDFRVSNADFG